MEKPIGISAEFIKPGAVGGAEYFLRNLISGFIEVLDGRERLSIFGPGNMFPEFQGSLSIIHGGVKSGNRFLRESLSFARHHGELRAMLFPNYFTPPWKSSCRIVTVIHDAQYLHFPENFTFKKRAWLQSAHRFSLLRADKVIAISEFVKADLLKSYGNKWERKIEVIHNPVSWERLKADEKGRSEAPKGRFILSVAAQYPHKNLATLIRAFASVRAIQPDVRLVLAGQLPGNLIGTTKGIDLRNLVKEMGLEGTVLITGHIPDSTLAALYEAAELFVFPSLFEGFGLPPVEALGFGLPVVTTLCGSIPEVTRKMAVYVQDPEDAMELAESIKAVLTNPAAFRKSPEEILRIRESYRPSAIAKRYLAAILS